VLTSEGLAHLAELQGPLSEIGTFTAEEIERVFKAFAESRAIKLGAVAQPMRVALTGGTASPGIFEVMEIIGKEKVMKRIARVLEGG
jgi:glutamyl-tRNA synthetase